MENIENTLPMLDNFEQFRVFLYGILSKLQADTGNEATMTRTNFELPHGVLFCPIQGGYGQRVCKDEYGQNVFLRIRSFKDGVLLHGKRAHLELEDEEIREVNVTVTDSFSALRVGSLTTIRFYKRLPLQFRTEIDLTEKCKAASVAVYGLGVSNLVLLDRHKKLSKKKLTQTCCVLLNCPLLILGSIDVTQQSIFQSNRLVPTSTVIQRSLSFFTLCEWVIELQNLSRYGGEDEIDLFSMFTRRVEQETYRLDSEKMQLKVKNELERQANPHAEAEQENNSSSSSSPSSLLPKQTMKTVDEVIDTAIFFSELTTLGHWLDVFASECYNCHRLPLFEDPFCLPLYLSMAVVLAVKPPFARQTAQRKVGEDAVVANAVFSHFRSLFFYEGVDSTLVESLVTTTIEDMAKTASISRRRRLNGGGDGEEEHTYSAPIFGDHIRRQGLALCHELAAVSSPEFVKQAAERAKIGLPDEVFEDALETVSPAFSPANNKGTNTRHHEANRVRMISKQARLRFLIQVMSDLEMFLRTGIYGQQRIFPTSPLDTFENEGGGDGDGNNPRNVGLSVEAFQTGQNVVCDYLSKGPLALQDRPSETHAPLNHIPMRARTRLVCGRCGESFPPFVLALRNVLTQCHMCNAQLCDSCLHESAKILLSRNEVHDNSKLFCTAACEEKAKKIMDARAAKRAAAAASGKGGAD